MTIASKGTIGTGGGTTNEASIVITTVTTAADVGDFVVVCFATDNSQTTDGDESAVSGVADNAVGTNNVWRKAREWTNGQGTAQTGCLVSVWYCNVTTAIPTGRTITATLTNSSQRDATSGTGWVFTNSGGPLSARHATVLASDGATAMASMDYTSLSTETLRVRATGIEYGTTTAALTATASPQFTKFTDAQTGSTAAGSAIRAEFIISTGTGAASAPSTTFTAADMSSVYVVFAEALLDAGSIGLTGSDATLTYAAGATHNALDCDSGSFTETGSTANLTPKFNYKLTGDAGAYTDTGATVAPKTARQIAFNIGILTESGATLSPQTARQIIFNVGTLIDTGSDATLTYTEGTPSGERYTLDCDPGTYSETGTTLTPKIHRFMQCSIGDWTETGATATGKKNLFSSLATGIYSETGTTSTPKRILSISTLVSQFAWTGATSDFLLAGEAQHRTLVGDPGLYGLTGNTITARTKRALSLSKASYSSIDATASLKRNASYIIIPGNLVVVASADLVFEFKGEKQLDCSAATYGLSGSATLKKYTPFIDRVVVQRQYGGKSTFEKTKVL